MNKPALRLQQGAGFKSVCDAGAKLLDTHPVLAHGGTQKAEQRSKKGYRREWGPAPSWVYLPGGLGGRGLKSV